MTGAGVVCRVRIAIGRGLFSVSVVPENILIQQRVQWAKTVTDILAHESGQDNVRPMDFVIDTATNVITRRLPSYPSRAERSF